MKRFMWATAYCVVFLPYACSNDNPCSVVNGLNGKKTLSCSDGTSVVISDGEAALIRLDTEEPGSNCAQGGTKVNAGIDANGDGQLSDDEISTTSYVCDGVTPGLENGTLEGSITVRNSLDAAMLEGCSFISGDLTISASGMTNLTLTHLTHIGGSLQLVGNTTLAQASFPALDTIGGDLQIEGNALLPDLDGLSALTDFKGFVNISNNPMLMDLEGLGQVSSGITQLSVEKNDSLESLDGLRQISSVAGSLRVVNNYKLADLSGMERITRIDGSISIYFNENLKSLKGIEGITGYTTWLRITDNPSLKSLEGLNNLELGVGDLTIERNDSLTTLSALGKLTMLGNDPAPGGSKGLLSIYQNNMLQNLGLNSLVKVEGSFNIMDNPSLPTCQAVHLKDQVLGAQGIGGTTNVSGNDDTGTCK